MSQRPSRRPSIEVVGRLDRAEVEAVTWLVEAATEADGVRPLSEHVALHLRYGGDAPGRNLLLWTGQEGSPGDGTRGSDRTRDVLAAYAHLDVTDPVDGSSAELVVHPDQRRHGYGRALVQALLSESPDGRLRLWAHGDHRGAGELAESFGFKRTRELWQMRRSLSALLPLPELPPDVTIRTFRPGLDDAAWVDLNARAFADHQEQGSWELDDLHRRMQEPWFDPAGFFLAEREGNLVGFHWTKVHGGHEIHDHEDLPPHAHEGHGHDPIGEVYVVGVAPEARGLGLGRSLTLVGLRHLRSRGLLTAMLYVDADNQAAVGLYASLGFARWDVDVVFSKGARRPAVVRAPVR